MTESVSGTQQYRTASMQHRSLKSGPNITSTYSMKAKSSQCHNVVIVMTLITLILVMPLRAFGFEAIFRIDI